MRLAIAGKCMKQMVWVALYTLALSSAQERSWAENASLHFQTPLSSLLTGCDAKPSDMPPDAAKQPIHDFCHLVKGSHLQIDKAERTEVISGNMQPQLLVQALRALLQDENYALIFTTDAGAREVSPPRHIVEVRIFPRTAEETPVLFRVAADGPETETTAERLEQIAIEAEHPDDRIEALASLTELGDANAEAVLLSFRVLHNDSSAAVREVAMDILLDLRGLDVYDVISKAAIEDPSPLLRIQALDNLVDLSRGSMLDALEAALLQALEDQDRRVSEHAEKLLTALE